jgi:uncharacterized protein (TIGR00369 family)
VTGAEDTGEAGDSGDAVDRAVAGHREVVAAGDHLFGELSMRDVAAGDGYLTIEMPVGRRISNSRGALQGGLLAALADVAAGRLAMDGVEAGHSTATSDITVHFLAPIVEGPARAQARVLRRGSRAVVIHVDIHDVATDRLAAVSTVAFVVLGPRPKPVR